MSKKLFMLATVMSLIMLLTVSSIYAQGTARGVVLSNVVIATAANMTARVTAVSPKSTNRRIVGAFYTRIPGDTNVGAGTTVNLIFRVYNWGNQGEMFWVAVSNANSNHGPWPKVWRDGNTSNYPTNRLPFLAMGAVTWFTLQVTVPATATNNSFQEYRVVLSATNPANFVRGRRYLGADGTTWYGGDMGIYAVGTTNNNGRLYTSVSVQSNALAGTNTYIRITVKIPVLIISKTIESITLGGVAVNPIPGAAIRYVVSVSNRLDAGAAYNLRIRDTQPANTTNLGASYIIITNNPGNRFRHNSFAGNILVVSNTNTGGLALNPGEKVVFKFSVMIK